MATIPDTAREQARWMKPNASLWVRPDAARFYRSGTELEEVIPALALKYSPNQPRVPSGNPDGGQWTDGEGGAGRLTQPMGNIGITDRRIASDADPESIKPGAQYAQATGGDRRHSVNLDEEEVMGGHTQRRHVGLTDTELYSRVQSDRYRMGFVELVGARHGSFDSRESANNLVNRTLEENAELVDRVARGDEPRSFITWRFGYRTGREAFRPDGESNPYLRDTYEVGVEIYHDPRSSRGYRVRTAYPRNSARR